MPLCVGSRAQVFPLIYVVTRYHWALLVGPKKEVEDGKGMRYHAKERPRQGGGSEWCYEEVETPLLPTKMLLTRVMVGKVLDKHRLVQVLSQVPIRQDQPNWNCVFWVKEALEDLDADRRILGTGVTSWDSVRDAAMNYTQQKKDEHRFDGQETFDMKKVPTYDLIEKMETVM